MRELPGYDPLTRASVTIPVPIPVKVGAVSSSLCPSPFVSPSLAAGGETGSVVNPSLLVETTEAYLVPFLELWGHAVRGRTHRTGSEQLRRFERWRANGPIIESARSVSDGDRRA